jgi:hypothetical protein
MTQTRSFGWRFGVVACSNVALLLAFIPALASARASHTFSWFAHPWQDIRQDIFIFAFAAVAVVAAIPVLTRGSMVQRVSVLALLLLPAYAVITFLIWSLRQT